MMKRLARRIECGTLDELSWDPKSEGKKEFSNAHFSRRKFALGCKLDVPKSVPHESLRQIAPFDTRSDGEKLRASRRFV